jgi:hypothetical protein
VEWSAAIASGAREPLTSSDGPHTANPSGKAVARDTTARFLLLAGVVDEADLPPGWLAPLPPEQHIVRVTQPVVATSMDFSFAAPYTGLEVFAEAGAVIGWSNGEAVRTPYDNCMLVMPSLRQLRPGVTVVRLGRIERTVARAAAES